MSKINDFRRIADEAMCDINVTEEMMNEVLRKGASKRRRTGMPMFRLAAAAACGVLVFGILHFTGILKPKEISIQQDDQSGIYSATANQPESTGTNDSMLIEPRITQQLPDSPQEAGRSFGEGFLIPSYIPEGFKPVDIYASGTAEGKTDSVVLNYSDGDRSFLITEQRATEAGEFPGFEVIDINGTTGYVSSQEQFTEVYWYAEGVRYSVSGMLAREDAIETARSMEPAG